MYLQQLLEKELNKIGYAVREVLISDGSLKNQLESLEQKSPEIIGGKLTIKIRACLKTSKLAKNLL